MVGTSCGTEAGPAGDESSTTPSTGVIDPVDIKVNLDETTAATALITAAGGNLSATAADGTLFTLTLPQGALRSDEQITMTPVSTIDGLPFSGGLVGAVQLAPEGLQLLQPATLTIESSRTPAAEGFETVAFGYRQEGQGLYLSPAEAKDDVLTLEVWHFSGGGAAQGTHAEVQVQREQHVPSIAEDAFTQGMQEMMGRERQSQVWTGEADANFAAKILAIMHERFASWLAPQLAIALEDCSKAPEIMARAIAAARQMELMGTTNEPGIYGKETKEFQAELDQISDTIAKVRAKCMKSYEASGMASGMVCDLGQPFELTVHASTDFPAEFHPSGPRAGTGTYDWNAYGTHWTGSGPYTVSGSDEALSLVWQVGNACATAPGGQYCTTLTITSNLAPLDSKDCGKP
jgi:hypothetical protein